MPYRLESSPEQTVPSPGLVAVDGRTFPLSSARLSATAQGGLATTTLLQAYDNPHAEPLEVLYAMPLPADGAVAAYTFRLGERVVRGKIETRDNASADYRRALAEGRTAGLLEQQRGDTFTQLLGNVPPGARVTVEIEVLHPLGFVPGEPPAWEYRWPTTVGVRYVGAADRVPDAELLAPPRADEVGTPARLEAELRIGDGAPDALAPRSPSHAVLIGGDGAATTVRLDGSSRLDRDLVVRWVATTAEVEARLVEGRGLAGGDGRYALITVTPPAAPHARFARDLTILVDASGSMSGAPIAQAKRVVEALLRSLEADDRFELLAFASQVARLTPGVVPASASAIESALAAIHDLRAGGGTEMADAVREALAALRAGSQRQVVLLTDGYVGFESEVVACALERCGGGAARLHVWASASLRTGR